MMIYMQCSSLGSITTPARKSFQNLGKPTAALRYYALQYWYTAVPYMHAVAQLVEALRYKPEGRGFDS